MYRYPTFDIEQMQSTMRHSHLDDISRNSGAKGKPAGPDVAKSAETSICRYCGKEGHLARTCWKKRDKASKSNGYYDQEYFGGKYRNQSSRWTEVVLRPQKQHAQRCGVL